MNRTRKWVFVEQEAKRLTELGLGAADIAQRLGVARRTVDRWITTGKLQVRRRFTLSVTGQNPAAWAATVRKDYALDATDDQLVTIAESMLAMALDPSLEAPLRMNAAGRFQALVKQLALVARLADQEQPETPAPQAPRATPRVDPRKVLTMAGRSA